MVYDNLKPIPIPEDAYVNGSDGRVFVYVLNEDGKKQPRVIGYVTKEKQTHMVTNSFFRDFYPLLWKQNYPDEPEKQYELSIGLYALVLSVITDIGLQEVLQSAYGYKHINSILDYSMFQLKDKSCITQLYEDTMYNEVLFAKQLYSDSWYSNFFKRQLKPDEHYTFRKLWMNKITQRGIKKVWLCLDGSNNDCQLKDGGYAELGMPKSHNLNKRIVGYMFAINSEDGRPVTYIDYEGSVPDSKAFQEMAVFLDGYGIEIEGVILDRGFPVEKVFETIEFYHWKYVIMLPQETNGHKAMVREYGDKIRWHAEYLIGEGGLFGVSDEQQISSKHERRSTICLFFDGISGSRQSVKLNKEVIAEKKRIEKLLAEGKSDIAIKPNYKRFFKIDAKQRKVTPVYSEWDKAMTSKGLYSMAVSKGISPETADHLYDLRMYSESVYSILKSQEGNDVTRVHSLKGLKSKIAISFNTTIIRTEILIKCKELALDTNVMLKKLSRIKLLRMENGTYNFVKNLTRPQEELFEAYNIDNDCFSEYARTVNQRMSSKGRKGNTTHKVAQKDEITVVKNTHQRGGNRKSKIEDSKAPTPSQEEKPKKKAGRPRGVSDTKPRKPRSDKGIKRGKYKKVKN